MLAGRSEHKGDLNQTFVSTGVQAQTQNNGTVLARAGDGRFLTYGLAFPSSRPFAGGWPETTADWTRSRETAAGSRLGAMLVGVES